MKLRLFLLFLSLCLVASIWPDQSATTDDGRKVILHDDGTWEYTSEELTADSTKDFNFRKTCWGMTKQQVRMTEKEQPVEEQNEYITYWGTVAGLNSYIIYIFVENTLQGVKYMILLEVRYEERDNYRVS